MLRLTYNAWRRGILSLSDEDYRWQVLRDKVPRWFFQVVNLVFIGSSVQFFSSIFSCETFLRSHHSEHPSPHPGLTDSGRCRPASRSTWYL
jgi:steroid 5-alpha reductase family enzyme